MDIIQPVAQDNGAHQLKMGAGTNQLLPFPAQDCHHALKQLLQLLHHAANGVHCLQVELNLGAPNIHYQEDSCMWGKEQNAHLPGGMGTVALTQVSKGW